MTPAQLAVLGDALRSVMTETDAADVLRWAQYPDDVWVLMSLDPITHDDYGTGCQVCRTSSTAHDADCAIVAAWERVDRHSLAEEVERAHYEAIEYMRRELRMAALREGNEWWREMESTHGPLDRSTNRFADGTTLQAAAQWRHHGGAPRPLPPVTMDGMRNAFKRLYADVPDATLLRAVLPDNDDFDPDFGRGTPDEE